MSDHAGAHEEEDVAGGKLLREGLNVRNIFDYLAVLNIFLKFLNTDGRFVLFAVSGFVDGVQAEEIGLGEGLAKCIKKHV